MTNACRTHCCLLHGCKYRDTNCPVANGVVKQEYLCEQCSWIGLTSVDDVKRYDLGKLKTCPHCNHVLEP